MVNNKNVAGVATAVFISCIVVLSYGRGRSTIFRDVPHDTFNVEYSKDNITDTTINIRLQQWENIKGLYSSQPLEKHVPDIIGIGVKKCGTGALIHFIGQHPLIKIPSRPETFFFTDRYSRGMKYYSHLMPAAREGELVMEKTPSYFYSAKALQRIKDNMPNAKVILSLCDPVARAFSTFVHNHVNEKDNNAYLQNTFHKQALKFVEKFQGTNYSEISRTALRACTWPGNWHCPFSRGIYHTKAKLWREKFNSSQLLVLNGDKWITDPGWLIEQIEEFLGIPKLLVKKDFIKPPESGFYCLNRWWNEIEEQRGVSKSEMVQEVDGKELFCLGSGKGRTRNGVRSMRPDTYEILKSFYNPHNELLYGILHQDMNW